ncbi:hypothetical protein ACFPAF_12650 [Hymenobacter endophyticus]|uniref:DUF2846 domain-containing protein n=1 Tax=Hymenobacter endophyticus TaxID=3076335 RepID=A0ABU3TIN9_9BACT|nr:hypothetical protein [Hymenobacter endophyticus]MDU0371249.1 hypothetical protein [Hymenobacter endophyticus]
MRKQFTRLAAAAAVAATISSCAGSYHAIRPDRLGNYQAATQAGAPVEFEYRYSALLANGANKKYVKKERKQGYQVVAVKVKNNTSTDLNFSRDLELTFSDRPIMPVPSVQAANDMKQGVAIYLLYVLGIGQVGGTRDPYTGQTTGGTILPWGPFAAAGNMIGASSANKNMRNEFAKFDLTNKVIRPGETVYGIVPLREANVAPLKLMLRTSAASVPVTVPATPPAATPAPSNGGQ